MAVKALTTIKHDGKLYKPGEIVEDINSKDESRLISLGAAEPIEAVQETDHSDDLQLALESMNKKELLAYSDELGMKLNEKLTVKELRAAIEEQLENDEV